MSRPQLILASASPRRLTLLDQIGVVPKKVLAADIDESVLKAEKPREHALRIASSKANAIIQSKSLEPHCVILAADTVVSCGRRILPKAETDEDVRNCLRLLSGRRHTVLTAVVLADSQGKIRSRVSETKVAFRRLEQGEIDAYILSREGIGKAGGYAIQGRAAVFVRFLAGSYSNVVGLPLAETWQMLKACAVV